MWTRGGIKGRVDEHLLDARSDLPPRLRAAFDRLLVARGLATPHEDAYFGVLGHPLFELPVWVAGRLEADGTPVGQEAISRVLGLSALGYLHARAHDDWLDRDCPDEVASVALAHALLARCTRLLVAVVGNSPRFWAQFTGVMDRYADALVATEEGRRSGQPVTQGDFALVLAQSRPLVIPSLALLDRAARWDLEGALEEFVFCTSATSQVFDDLTDYHRDTGAGQPTWVSGTLDAAGGDAAWMRLAAPGARRRSGAVGERVQEALAFHARATAAARALGLDAAGPWLAARRTTLESLPEVLSGRIVAAFRERLVGAAAGQPLRETFTQQPSGAEGAP